eukprot:307487_1
MLTISRLRTIGCNHIHSRSINIPGMEFIASIASNFISSRLSNGFQNISYIPHKLSLWRRNFKHQSIRLLTRDTNDRLFVIADQFKIFEHLYNVEKTGSNKDIAVVVCLGKKKKAKSFNASMISFVSSNEPCHFGIGSRDNHFTIGLEITPVLSLSKYQGQVKKLCIIDFEGHECDDTSHDNITMYLMKKIIHELNPVIVLSCLNQINNEDIKFCQLLLNETTEKANKPPLIVALPAGTVDEPEKGENYAKIKQIYPSCHFCELPWLGKDSNKKVRKAMQTLPFKNPTRYMSKQETKKYHNLSKMVLDYAIDSRSTSEKIVTVIHEIKHIVENNFDDRI